MSSSLSDSPPIDLAHEADFRIGHLAVSPSTREISGPTGSEILEPRVMQVLVALARRRGQIVSRDDLIRDCWGGRIVGEDALNRCIGRIRRLAEADGGFALETVPRVGYRLRETAPATSDTPADEQSVWRRRPVLPIALAVAVLLAGAVLAFWFLRPAAKTPPAAVATIAVVPFDPLGQQEDLRVFADGVAEQIQDVLSDNQVQSVTRDTGATLRGPGRDATAAALGVRFIVDGTVARGDAGLHVTVHLDHVPTHVTLWTGTFDEAGAGATTLQTQVAAKIVDVIQAALRAHRADGSPLEDVALSAYIKAMDNVRMLPARPHQLQARDLLHIVTARAPDFSMGYSALAIASVNLARDKYPDEARALVDESRNAAALALVLDPHNAETYIALGLLIPSRHWAEREAAYRKGIAINPDWGALQNFLGTQLESEGFVAESVQLKQRGLMLDPLSPVKSASVATALANAGHCADAITAIDRDAKLWPRQPMIWGDRVAILGNCGRDADTLALLATPPPPALSLDQGYYDSWRAYLAARTANTPEAKAHAVQTVLAARAARALYDSAAMEMLAQLGDIDAAFAIANDTFPVTAMPHEQIYTNVLFWPTTTPMRRDKRFMPLMQRVGLAAFWIKSGKWPDFCSEPGLPYDCRKAAATAP